MHQPVATNMNSIITAPKQMALRNSSLNSMSRFSSPVTDRSAQKRLMASDCAMPSTGNIPTAPNRPFMSCETKRCTDKKA